MDRVLVLPGWDSHHTFLVLFGLISFLWFLAFIGGIYRRHNISSSVKAKEKPKLIFLTVICLCFLGFGLGYYGHVEWSERSIPFHPSEVVSIEVTIENWNMDMGEEKRLLGPIVVEDRANINRVTQSLKDLQKKDWVFRRKENSYYIYIYLKNEVRWHRKLEVRIPSDPEKKPIFHVHYEGSYPFLGFGRYSFGPYEASDDLMNWLEEICKKR